MRLVYVNVSHRLGLACPITFNPADFYIQALAIAPGREEQCRQNVQVTKYEVETYTENNKKCMQHTFTEV